MKEKSIEEVVKESRLSEHEKNEFCAMIHGELLAKLYSDIVAKHVFSPDVHPERMDFILQRTMKDASIKVEHSAANESNLMTRYSKKTISDIPAWLKDHRISDLEIQAAAQEYIFNRTDIYASNMLLLQYSVEVDQPKSEVDYLNVHGAIIIVLMVNSPAIFKNNLSKRYIHRITKARADSGMEFPMLKQMVFVQLDKALELYMNDSYNEDEDVELLKMFALIKDINNEKLAAEGNAMFDAIKKDVYDFTRDREVQQMILAEDLAIMDWNSNMRVAREEGFTQGVSQGISQGITQGISQGISQGIAQICDVNNWLFAQGRADDVRKAAQDKEFMNKMIDEYVEAHQAASDHQDGSLQNNGDSSSTRR